MGRADSVSFIYVISSDTGHSKVGKANDPEKRLKILATGHPTECRLASIIPVAPGDALRLEQECHRQLKSRFSSKGEWYKAAAEDVTSVVQEVCSSAAMTAHVTDPLVEELELLRQRVAFLQREMLIFDRIKIIFSPLLRQLDTALEDAQKTTETIRKIIPGQKESGAAVMTPDVAPERGELGELTRAAENYARIGRRYEFVSADLRRLDPPNETMQLEYVGALRTAGREAHVVRLHSRTSLLDQGLGYIARVEGRYYYWASDVAFGCLSSIPEDAQHDQSLLEAFMKLDSQFTRTR